MGNFQNVTKHAALVLSLCGLSVPSESMLGQERPSSGSPQTPRQVDPLQIFKKQLTTAKKECSYVRDALETTLEYHSTLRLIDRRIQNAIDYANSTLGRQSPNASLPLRQAQDEKVRMQKKIDEFSPRLDEYNARFDKIKNTLSSNYSRGKSIQSLNDELFTEMKDAYRECIKLKVTQTALEIQELIKTPQKLDIHIKSISEINKDSVRAVARREGAYMLASFLKELNPELFSKAKEEVLKEKQVAGARR